MADFAKGMRIEKFEYSNKAGEPFVIYKLGINKYEFLQNPFNDNGWANFEIKFAAESGKPYIIIDSFKNLKMSKACTPYRDSKQEVDTEELPF